MEREARICRRLKHPNIVRLHDSIAEVGASQVLRMGYEMGLGLGGGVGNDETVITALSIYDLGISMIIAFWDVGC